MQTLPLYRGETRDWVVDLVQESAPADAPDSESSPDLSGLVSGVAGHTVRLRVVCPQGVQEHVALPDATRPGTWLLRLDRAATLALPAGTWPADLVLRAPALATGAVGGDRVLTPLRVQVLDPVAPL